MKTTFLLTLVFLSSITHCQVNSKILNNGQELAEYISKNFYSELFSDSCYMGIHYITVSFNRKDSAIIQISGNINSVYNKRIKSLLSGKIWNDNFVTDSKKKDRVIIQPIFLDITKNCAYDTITLTNLGIAPIEEVSKQKIYELSTNLLVKQRLDLLNSYKSLHINIKSKKDNYLLLSPCYITARPTKEKIIM